MKRKWRRGKLRSGKKIKKSVGESWQGKEKMDRGAEVKEEEEEDISYRYGVVMAGVCD